MERIEIKETDWKLYRSRIGDWQEAFMEKLLNEYMTIINDEKLPSERFWKLHDKIKEDSTKTGVIARNARSSMISNIVHLLQEGAITYEDLDGLSDELIERVKFLYEN